jgi:glycosyltransferase involved in cell wall biosynthesis
VSFFSSLTTKALTMRRLGQLPKVPFVLAPQGELSAGALQIKSAKKRAFIALTKNFGIYNGIVWKASGEEEKADVVRVLGNHKDVRIVPDLTPRTILRDYSFAKKPAKEAGKLRLIFLSRVNRKKNLSHALRALQNVNGQVVFDVYGAHDDEIYWQECQELIKQLPANVQVAVHGSIDYRDVLKTMLGYHYFILPTLNENFGHVVLEALAAGCPVLLSDNTPWRDLAEKGIGWDIPLNNSTAWEKVLQICVDQTEEEYRSCAESARRFALEWLAAPEVEELNRQILRDAVGGARH